MSTANKHLELSTSWQKMLRQHRAIAVIRVTNINQGLEMAKAVATGGMRLIEITWNSESPAKIIKKLRQELPECLIGTGTILTLDELKNAISSGIQFCFTPHVNLSLIETALEQGVPIIPGALSPSEIVNAWQAGGSCVKVFPVQAVGGINYIKGLQGPLGSIPLIPTGGVTLENAVNFIEAGAIAVGLSGQLFPSMAIETQDWETVTKRAQTLMKLLKRFSLT
ncbi:bifunctional 4-hydroxy-2-oxoglutarate aldolase/2-dehydro-3-deoxy-phosphogluconate aldolase [Aphanothece sacrum]|nr:bifunctional 4-hydroxy-2-oxoglutarate aldolase/2-dehydro-3-deoxy-phosphogluconate aldolase [Aphanothece sacrum]